MDIRNTTDRDPLFDALRAEVGRLDAPRGVEKELLQAFAKLHPPKRRWYHRLAVRPAALAGGVVAGALVLAFAVRAPHPVEDGRAGALVALDGNGVFIALDSAERIAAEPAPRMVATDVPRTSLAALGVPLTPENAGDSVRAEMLVAADGQPLALRLSAIQ
ncbi:MULTISPECIES: hypothetical protein [Massilia]|jgi:hypothetical protein|uniref:Uncharacterized protein n=2 Tax=Massilia TaxID=149698 RepID=A0A7X3FV42_9BURK|nr:MULTISPECIES: hypothetical protein [Telluria group]KQY12952.1 hypothetical protein ASD28_27480 [Massilia sp. Root133]MDN4046337.1 hypothetical protein [Massilia sp. YIM B02787]MVW58408.1 hypothetical protein [Telluria cellulosilytica]